MYSRTPKLVTALNAITATTSSLAVDVASSRRVTIAFTEGGIVNNRSGVLSATGSIDGTNYFTYNLFIDDVTNTNLQNFTRIATKTRAAAGTDMLILSPEFTFTHLILTVTVTDDALPTGNFTVKVLVEY